jgi:hypothetical protein
VSNHLPCVRGRRKQPCALLHHRLLQLQCFLQVVGDECCTVHLSQDEEVPDDQVPYFDIDAGNPCNYGPSCTRILGLVKVIEGGLGIPPAIRVTLVWQHFFSCFKVALGLEATNLLLLLLLLWTPSQASQANTF